MLSAFCHKDAHPPKVMALYFLVDPLQVKCISLTHKVLDCLPVVSRCYIYNLSTPDILGRVILCGEGLSCALWDV